MKMLSLLGTLLGLAIICLLFMLLSNVSKGQHISYQSALTDRPVDLNRMASAILATENSPRDYIGYAGERSSYQITPDVWDQHSKFPHEWGSGSDPVCVNETRKVVRKHLEWIVSQLQKGGWTVSPYAIGCVWKAGWGRWSRHELRFSDTTYGTRAMNVYAVSE